MPPRVTLLSGEARNTMVDATSSTLGQAAKSAFGMAARLAGVSMIEGATALTRMPDLATSSASATVSAATAALLAVYAAMPAPLRHSSAGRAATLTMRPPVRMTLRAARQHRNVVTKFISRCVIRSVLLVAPTADIA